MTHPMWLRFLDIGSQLAADEPELFPTVVLLLEELAAGNARSRPPRPPAATTLADVLILADPTLADIANLQALLAPMPAGERLAAEAWALASIAARGDAAHTMTMPGCVSRLYQLLATKAQESS